MGKVFHFSHEIFRLNFSCFHAVLTVDDFLENCTKSVLKHPIFSNASLLEADTFSSHIDFSRSVNPIRLLFAAALFIKILIFVKALLLSNPCSLSKHFSLLKNCSFSKCSSLYGCFSLIGTLSFSYFIH